jgi:hypothetical protein
MRLRCHQCDAVISPRHKSVCIACGTPVPGAIVQKIPSDAELRKRGLAAQLDNIHHATDREARALGVGS